MLKPILIASLAGTTFLVGACKPGYNRIYDNSDPDDENPDCVEAPISAKASDKTKEVFRLIADLSCERLENYVLVGQSLGSGNQIADESDTDHSFNSLIDGLSTKTTQRPAIISVDYEATRRYNEAELDQANDILISHDGNGGIVSVTWAPINPWRAESDATPLAPTKQDAEKLTVLYGEDDGSEAWSRFNTQIELVTKQLKELSDKGVPVLFAPFPEMNSIKRWYANDEDNTEAEFRELWDYVVRKIEAESPTNLLWVYAPRSGNATIRNNPIWGYPGKAKVDIVAGISYSDELSITDYDDYIELDKPLGMTRLAPSNQTDGNFDNTFYSRIIPEDNPYIAYWIADHDTSVEGENKQNRSIVSNKNVANFFAAPTTATLSTIKTEGWIDL